MMCILLFAIIMGVVMSANSSGCGIKCFSYSCLHNKGGRCGRREIVVYDNTVTGLCLHHTKNMKQRILDPMQEKQMIESSEFGSEIIGKIMKAQEEKLLKDPDAFAKWMGKVIRKKA